MDIDPNIERVLKVIYPKKKAEDVLTMLEEAMEKDLLDNVFPRLSINASKKSDRKQLPYHDEIIVSIPRTSWGNGILEYHRCYRKIIKELLEKDVYKIRFYVDVDTDRTIESPFFAGQINYKFRYYIHEIK